MPRIVIIGAGPAGINAVQTFANTLKATEQTEIVVLEKSKYYYHTIGAPRAYTEESYAKSMFIPYDDAIPANAKPFVKFVRAIATGISANPNEVSYQRIGADEKPVSTTEVVSYDYLIIATGSTYSVPIKQDANNFSRAYTEAKIKEVRDNIANSDKILIVGGGAVGCEVAGDIASHFPKKQVTLVSSQPKLVMTDNVKDKLRDKLLESLKELNVRVILGEKLDERLTGNSFEYRSVRTDKGTVIESDIQLLCAGFHPAAELVEALDPSLVDQNGTIKVNDLLQLDHPAYKNIFALGDVTNHTTPKMAFYAGEQAKHIVKELIAVIRKSQSAVTKPFPAVAVQALVVPLGPNGGAAQLPLFGGWVLGNFTTRMIKSKDLFAGMTWGSLGATVPK